MLLKQKRNGTIKKGHGCADGRKQRAYTTKEDASSSPAVAKESLYSSCVIDAMESRDEAMVDITGEFCLTTNRRWRHQ